MIRLLEHVLKMPVEKLAELGIQDAALCDLWYSTRSRDASKIKDQERFPDVIEEWRQNANNKELQTEGRRHQTLLRELLDVVHEGKTDSLARDELSLLLRVHKLACDARHSDAFERVRVGIERHIDKLRQRHESLPRERGLPRITQRFRVVNTEDIQRARAQEVRMVAGVELPSRGPVLTQRGHLRVLGDVPERATLVVEDGSCVVDGFVMGRVAVSGACEVFENLCGVVIARNGDIRARNIVDGAFVVAKRGWVHCRRAQNAELIFGGECVKIREASVEGRILSKKILIEGEAEGGEMHVGLEIKAERYMQSVNRPMNIVFRKRLSCKDYGEEPGLQMSADVSHALHLRGKLHFTNQQMVFALSEAEQFAGNAISYLLVGEEVKVHVDRMTAAQGRLNVVNRIILTLATLYSECSSKLEAATEEEKPQSEGDGDANQLLDDLDTDIERLEGNADEKETLAPEKQEIAHLRKNLLSCGSTPEGLANRLAELGQKLNRWRREAETLESAIQEHEERTRTALRAKNLLIDESKKKTKLLALKEIIAKVKAGPSDSPMAFRVADSYTAILLRSIQSRVELSKKFHAELETVRAQFQEARDGIWESYQMDIDEVDDSQMEMRASGVFDSGVNLHADLLFLNGDAPPGPDASITTGANGNAPSLYLCRAGTISKIPIEEDATPPAN